MGFSASASGRPLQRACTRTRRDPGDAARWREGVPARGVRGRVLEPSVDRRGLQRQSELDVCPTAMEAQRPEDGPETLCVRGRAHRVSVGVARDDTYENESHRCEPW